MIFHRLAEKGFTFEQVLDFTPHITRVYLSDRDYLLQTDNLSRENEIRANLKLYDGKRILTMKYQKQLDEHLEKTAQERKQLIDRIRQMIIAGVSNG